MSQKVGLILIAVLVACVGFAGYFIYFDQEVSKVETSISAVPPNAAMILRVKQPVDKWTSLDQKAAFWNDLKDLKNFSSIGNTINTFDSIISKNSQLFTSVLQKEPILVSFHVVGVGTPQALIVFNSNDAQTLPDIENVLSKYDVKAKISSRMYEEVPIRDVIFDDNERLTVAMSSGIVMISADGTLVEDAVRHLKHGKSLASNESFAKIFKSADPKTFINLFLNYNQLYKLTNDNVEAKFVSSFQKTSTFGQWAELDVNIKSDGVMMNGFSNETDSISTYLKLFAKQKPQRVFVTNILPDNSSYFNFYGFSDFEAHIKNYKTYLSKQKELYQFEKSLKNINSRHSFDVYEDFYSWIGSELCMAVTKPEKETVGANSILAIHVNDIEKAQEKLNKILTNVNANGEIVEFRNFKIYDLGLTNFIPLVLGKPFALIEKSNYVVIEDYVVFANNSGALKHVVNSYLKGKTLTKDVNFNSFFDKFSDQTNLMTYLNFKLSEGLWEHYLKPDFYQTLEEIKDTIQKFESFGYQLNSSGNLFYTNAYLKYNPNYENKSHSLLESKLDTSYSIAPTIVRNHYSDENEIFIQDDANVIYLINNVGKVLWKAPIKGQILGGVHQVDRYRNKKLQYLFNTSTHIYLVDRNGNNVDGYPIKLESKATAPLSVFDYDKNRKYRVLVPCANKKVLNFDVKGKEIKGWKFKQSDAIIRTPIEWLSIKGKDYIVMADESGKVKIVDRKGKDRVVVKGQIPVSKNNNSIIVRGATIDESYIANTDSTGTYFTLRFDGTLSSIPFKAFSSNHVWKLYDVNGDGAQDVVYIDNNAIYAYKTSKPLIFHHEIDAEIDENEVTLHTFADETIRIGYINKTGNKVYLINDAGTEEDGFPVEGNSSYVIGDIDKDGRFEFIVGDKHGSLYFYSLSQ